MEKVKVLLAEDDDNLGKLLNTFLDAKGYKTTLVDTGKKAVEKAGQEVFDFIILDVMMPEMDGFEAAEEIRSWNKEIPILFLTAKSLKEDKLRGFNLGADDYLTKPFSMEELLARLQAIMRRVKSDKPDEVRIEKIGDSEFDVTTRVLKIGGKELTLTTKEAQLLNMLIKSQDDHLDRQVALRAVWGDDNYFNGRSMDVYITKLRKILKDDEKIQILNVHGKGFRLIINQ